MYKKKTINVIIQARMGSTRFPEKVLKKLGNKKVLDHVYDRVNKSKIVDKIIVATSTKNQDDQIEEWAKSRNIYFFRGEEENVLKRYYKCSKKFSSDVICRVTADCPLISYKLTDRIIKLLIDGNYDFVAMNDNKIPRGIYGSAVTKNTLYEVFNKAHKEYQKEHVTYYIYEDNDDEYSIYYLEPPKWLQRDYRLTLDTDLDYKLLKQLFKHIDFSNEYIPLKKIIEFLDKNEEIAKINKTVSQKKVE